MPACSVKGGPACAGVVAAQRRVHITPQVRVDEVSKNTVTLVMRFAFPPSVSYGFVCHAVFPSFIMVCEVCSTRSMQGDVLSGEPSMREWSCMSVNDSRRKKV